MGNKSKIEIAQERNLKELSSFKYPNGLLSWAETHHEIVEFMTSVIINNSHKDADDIFGVEGIGGRYELAIQWTSEFEMLHAGREWDGEFFDAIEEFLSKKPFYETIR